MFLSNLSLIALTQLIAEILQLDERVKRPVGHDISFISYSVAVANFSCLADVYVHFCLEDYHVCTKFTV